jgi:hypothetical protein
MDGSIYAFDSQFSQLLGSIADAKTYHLFAVGERQNGVVVVNKKKLSHYGWQHPGFTLRREFNLIDVPKSIAYVKNSVIIAYKKFYECLDLTSGLTSRILDVEREHKMVITEVNILDGRFKFLFHASFLLICFSLFLLLFPISAQQTHSDVKRFCCRWEHKVSFWMRMRWHKDSRLHLVLPTKSVWNGAPCQMQWRF